jgi:hypothetical protein
MPGRLSYLGLVASDIVYRLGMRGGVVWESWGSQIEGTRDASKVEVALDPGALVRTWYRIVILGVFSELINFTLCTQCLYVHIPLSLIASHANRIVVCHHT